MRKWYVWPYYWKHAHPTPCVVFVVINSATPFSGRFTQYTQTTLGM